MLFDKCHGDATKRQQVWMRRMSFELICASLALAHGKTFYAPSLRALLRTDPFGERERKKPSLGWSRTLSWRAANINMRAAAGGVGAR